MSVFDMAVEEERFSLRCDKRGKTVPTFIIGTVCSLRRDAHGRAAPSALPLHHLQMSLPHFRCHVSHGAIHHCTALLRRSGIAHSLVQLAHGLHVHHASLAHHVLPATHHALAAAHHASLTHHALATTHHPASHIRRRLCRCA
ncbi:hypothetical protein [Noviherbaspirillum pedocola]|uniref:Uncharacterized protein n=1 Tax=Noviherbaspirillum pedocola TaxID=2801341 RepID=A0A934T321_9BURK|nr:hypothetical protein [Noviherbaspirillum pedocola]MBK4738827.1 hypothetical protein [Noviherbaspirillum pedocola]